MTTAAGDGTAATTTTGAGSREHNRWGQSPRTVVMADVAEMAGVSQMTVSRVVNDTAPVARATRERVLAAMDELDYRPNAAARALVTGRSRVLGVIGFNTTLFGPASTLFGIQEAARKAGYFVSVASLRELDPASIDDAVRRLGDQGVDGLVVMTPHPTAIDALSVLPDDLPAVAVMGGSHGDVPSVTVDQVGGAQVATRHLLDLGHRTVHHLAGPHDWVEAVAREDGWRSTLVAAGVDVPAVLVGDWGARSGYELGRDLLAGDDEVTAVFAANDPMALGLYRAVHEAGLSIPDDISVVGFDDVPEAAFFAPPLTTVAQDFDEVGALSLRTLLQQIEDAPDPTRSRQVPVHLVTRASTGPARGGLGGATG